MGKGSNLYFQQQQARQLREMEKHQAAQSGRPLRKLTWTERHVLGLKDDPDPRPAEFGDGAGWAGAEDETLVAGRGVDRAERARKETESVGDRLREGPRDAPRMEVQGHLIDVTWDGEDLVVTPANKVASIALRGPDHRDGPLELLADDIASTDLKQAGALTNGRLTIHTKDRRTYLLHFRRKSNAEFARLYKALPG